MIDAQSSSPQESSIAVEYTQNFTGLEGAGVYFVCKLCQIEHT